ncbi:MAG: hypothetical protein JNK90_08690 [Planctomycetaceae bacterium]|nr:hypothetical protein [Planctomycetaceae bacterium]
MYLCPQCLQDIDSEESHKCEFKFLANSLGDTAQTWITTLGETSHGKTTLLEAILEMLRRLQAVIPGFAINGIDAHSKNLLQSGLSQKRVAPATKSIPKQVLLEAYNFPNTSAAASARQLLYFFDSPGEFLNSPDEHSVQQLKIVLQQTVSPWLIYELAGPEQFANRAPLGSVLSNLIHRYMESNVSLADRTIIVTYTMSQKSLGAFPLEIQAYLNSDPFLSTNHTSEFSARGFDFGAYMRNAQRVSDILHDLTALYPHGGNLLLELAKQNRINLKFCLTESIGHDVSDGVLHDTRSPKRVLDPLFWSVYLGQNGTSINLDTLRKPRIKVLIDPDLAQNSPWFQQQWLSIVWKNLSKFVDLDFYFMGRLQPETIAPTAPPQKPPLTRYIPVIAPLLADNKTGNPVLIIADKLPHDLQDFAFHSETNQLILLVTNEANRDLWQNTFLIRNSDDLTSLRTLMTQ